MLKKIISFIPFSILLWFFRKEVLGANYHLIAQEELEYVWPVWHYKNKERWVKDILFLKKHFNFVSYQDLLENRLPKYPLLLTFDDGYKELFIEIYPLLEQENIPAIYFLTTSLIDNKMPLYRNVQALLISNYLAKKNRKEINETFNSSFENDHQIIESIKSIQSYPSQEFDLWMDLYNINIEHWLQSQKPYLTSSQIKKLSDSSLITLGAHSISHQPFKNLEIDAQKYEIGQSIKTIMQISKKDKIPFAFPYSSKGVNFNNLQDIESKPKHYFGEWYPKEIEPKKPVIRRFSLDNPEKEIKTEISIKLREALRLRIHKLYQ